MDLSLIEFLTCPRCGPAHGLILLPDEVRDRRVVTGVLGCANCRERYVVEGGVADLRGDSGVVGGGGEARDWGEERGEGVGEAPGGGGREAAVRLAALLGLAEAGGVVLLTGPAAELGERLAEVAPGTTVVTTVGVDTSGSAVDSGVGSGVVSRLRLGKVLALRTGGVRGVALTGGYGELVEEGGRLVAPAGRLVLDPAPAGARDRVEAGGLRVLVEEGGVLVAGRGG